MEISASARHVSNLSCMTISASAHRVSTLLRIAISLFAILSRIAPRPLAPHRFGPQTHPPRTCLQT